MKLLTEGERALPVLQSQATGVLCSICPDPGRCCRRFNFHHSFWVEDGFTVAQLKLRDAGVPFIIEDWLAKSKTEDGSEYASVVVHCPKVTAEGLCSIYDDRPDICRNFQPGSDRLCVFASQNGIKFWEHDEEAEKFFAEGKNKMSTTASDAEIIKQWFELRSKANTEVYGHNEYSMWVGFVTGLGRPDLSSYTEYMRLTTTYQGGVEFKE